MSGPIALLLALFAAAEMPEFRAVDFGKLGRITGVSYEDLDGDGHVEVLVFSGHRLRVYRRRGHSRRLIFGVTDARHRRRPFPAPCFSPQECIRGPYRAMAFRR